VIDQSGERPLILASASPRRRELLSRLDIPFEVIPANVDEDAPERTPREERIARRLARSKAEAIAASYPGATVLAADTIVVYRGRLLAKPGDEAEARAMLTSLRGRSHRVITGIAVARGRHVAVSHATTRVQMRAYSDDEIARYIERGEPFDKAGGYAIQDPEFHPVDRYDGCYCNVVGLPLAPAIAMLREAGIAMLPASIPSVCDTCPLWDDTPS
jgi:MAF protein